MRTIDWAGDAVELVDQTLLPDRCVRLRVETVAELVAAIRRLAVRGAPALGVAAALRVRDDDIAACLAMSERGAGLLEGDRLRIMTVCNTGGLAAVERGTALGVIQTLHERGRLAEVLALEPRPLLQGARLTTWELARMGAPHRLVADSAGPYLPAKGEVYASRPRALRR
ncbi:hypothetical protein [Nonomuraea sp. NPDC052265]|uniref:hypothetical protein n=1 Tax=Nonomuraea sp. NPDC052265 TaxID=3364374 RepID=UPI0037C96B55